MPQLLSSALNTGQKKRPLSKMVSLIFQTKGQDGLATAFTPPISERPVPEFLATFSSPPGQPNPGVASPWNDHPLGQKSRLAPCSFYLCSPFMSFISVATLPATFLCPHLCPSQGCATCNILWLQPCPQLQPEDGKCGAEVAAATAGRRLSL